MIISLLEKNACLVLLSIKNAFVCTLERSPYFILTENFYNIHKKEKRKKKKELKRKKVTG